MKFIHISDVHYGMNPDVGKAWSKERSNAIKNTFHNIINACKENKVDFLFISGDLFHRQALIRDLKEVNYLFSSISDVKVIIIAGNHDYIKKGSALDSFSFADNVFFIKSPDLSGIYFSDLNTEVFGFSYYDKELRAYNLDDIRSAPDDRISILMAHGGDTNHFPFDKNSLIKKDFTYYALGHIHKHEVLFYNKMAYPGSPEPLDSSESGEHGYLFGEIDDISKSVTRLDFIPCASASYISLVLNISTDTTNTELLMRITNEINKRGTHNIYKLKIKGLRDPDIEFDLDILYTRFRLLNIIDESEPNYDFDRLMNEHSSDMLGFFINELNKTDMRTIEKKALFYGVNALLKTSDERS